MKKMAGIIFLLVGVALWSGCSTVSVKTDWDEAADFSRLKTFKWTSEMQKKTGDPVLDDARLNWRIRGAVDEFLEAKGYEKIVSEETPDFVVNYTTARQGKVAYEDIKNPVYNVPMVTVNGKVNFNAMVDGPSTMATHYEEGTLVLDIANPRTKKLIWRGTLESLIRPGGSEERKLERVRNAIRKLLSEFPPQG